MSEQKLILSQFEQYLSKAAWILKGPIEASDFKAYIFPMLFFKRISDVYDDEYRQALTESDGDEEYAQLPEFHKFIVPEGCHWDDVREAALTELFLETKTDQTPDVVERIVKVVRFDGWQDSIPGEREVQKSLRKALLKYQLHKDQTLFDRAYAYIRECY